MGMSRKKWTAQLDVTESLQNSRDKRKWQIALRRYVLEKNKSSFYAPFFGLGIETFRKWIEAQFDDETNWENFSEAWQFDHIVPMSYFDFESEEDMKLCWNFCNIRIEKIDPLGKHARLDLLAAKSYFAMLFEQTGYVICKKMMEKLAQMENPQLGEYDSLVKFIRERKFYLETLSGCSSYYFDKLNTGTPIGEIRKEIEFLQKFEKNA